MNRYLLFFIIIIFPYNIRAQEIKSSPNVVFVLIDDLGSAWIPPYAENLLPTDMEDVIVQEYKNRHKADAFDIEKHLDAARNSMPFLAKLSEDGIKFNKCFTTSALCAPSRAGILTSRYSQNWGGSTIPEVIRKGIPKDYQILPKLFQENGYSTGLIGKWHVAARDETLNKIKDIDHYKTSSAIGQHPLDNGFDYYYGYNAPNSTYIAPKDIWENRKMVPPFPEEAFLTDIFNTKAKNFVQESINKKKPFFLIYSPMTIHGGLTACPDKYKNQFDTGIWFSDNFAGHLLALDKGIEGIYDVLKQSGQIKNTLFILCSDNGGVTAVPPYNSPYKGGKGTGWLGGSHSPLIMVMPGRTATGFSNKLVSTLDILPTALDVAGIDIPEQLDGISLKKVIFGEKFEEGHSILYSSGLHSSRWSYSYYDNKQQRNMDNEDCPIYAWSLNDTFFSLSLTAVKPGTYENFPFGTGSQNFFYNYEKDPLGKKDVKKNSEYEFMNTGLKNWLKKQVELDRQHDHELLIQQVENVF